VGMDENPYESPQEEPKATGRPTPGYDPFIIEQRVKRLVWSALFIVALTVFGVLATAIAVAVFLN
jgi:hypothetical protein